jgi:hypothetical protein
MSLEKKYAVSYFKIRKIKHIFKNYQINLNEMDSLYIIYERQRKSTQKFDQELR